jgi:O-antigen ligase
MTSPGHFSIAVPKHLLMTFAGAVLVFWLWSGCVPASIFSGIADGTIVCPLGFSDFMTAVPLQQQPRPMAYQAAQAQSHMSTDMLAGVSGFQRLGYVVMVGYLFLIFSRIFDVKFGFLHIPGIAYRVFLVMMLLSRAFLPALRHPIGKAMYFLTFWFFLSIPFSMWKGGSLPVFMEAWLPTFVIFLSVSGMLANFDQCRKAIFIVAYGLFVLALIAVFFGNTEESGRLFLTHGKFSNPNEMAQALLMGLPLWWLIYKESKSMGKKVASAGIMFLMLLMISKCGSRGAMITFFVLILMVFVRTSITGKMQVLMSGVAIFAILLALMPGRLMRRYTTMTEDSEAIPVAGDDYDAGMQASAITSAQHRRDLLRRSIKYTFQHPLFGVGPGMFPVAEDADMRAQGFPKGTWQGTHNSYTQVSSEEGIPAGIAYVLVIIISFRKTSKLYKQTRGDPRLSTIANCALAVNYCVIVYAVSVFFDYIAYTSMLSVFAGFAMAMDLHAAAEIARLTVSPAEAQPIPFTEFRPNWRRPVGVTQEA